MHLLPRDLHDINDGDEAVDLGQTPGDMVFLSFSDSELTLVATQYEKFNKDFPSLRCAPLAQLKHPYSIDLYLENVVSHAKIIVVRLLGGKDYWRYGVEQLSILAKRKNILLAIIPGDIVADDRLTAASTLSSEILNTMWSYFQDSGPENIHSFLCYCSYLLGGEHAWNKSASVKNAGYCLEASHTNASASARAMIVFYRSLYLADDFKPIEIMAEELFKRDFSVLSIYVTSIKEPNSEIFLTHAINDHKPDIIINTTAFSSRKETGCVLELAQSIILQAALSTSSKESWEASARGANTSDLAMNIVLPEIDGRILTRAISHKKQMLLTGACQLTRTFHDPERSRISFVADYAKKWHDLRSKQNFAKKIALIFSNYPSRQGRSGYALGLDTPESAVNILNSLSEAGYSFNKDTFTNKNITDMMMGHHTARININNYKEWQKHLPSEFIEKVNAVWGPPEKDSSFMHQSFIISAMINDNLIVSLQPGRGDGKNIQENYHDLNIPPRHAYIAFYLWLRFELNIDAIIHMGAHGTLEWLPGKSVFLSDTCTPELILGATPVIYPFIVNDPGEAAHAKRRSSAVTIGHLTPKLIQSDLYDAALTLETLLDEYTQASSLDIKRSKLLAKNILREAETSGLAIEAGITENSNTEESLANLDKWICDLKEMRIGDGLHIFAHSDNEFDRAISAENEKKSLLSALAGKFVEPGPGGALSRGRADVLPTGRNIYCIDPRQTPTRTAYDIGRKAAHEVITHYLQQHGDYPRNIMLDLWGSATIRTGGEDFAQALALLGVIPLWDPSTSRVTGFEILPQSRCEFPRVDVTLHVSGLFRDMFPGLIEIFFDAVKAISKLDEAPSFNPLVNISDQERIFGVAEGAYEIGVSARINSCESPNCDDLAQTYLHNVGHAITRSGGSYPAWEIFSKRVSQTDIHVHTNDTADFDVFSGPAFVDFEGGFSAANRYLHGKADCLHVDATNPDNLKIRSLEQEISKTVRMKIANPRWLAGQMKHGYRGAAEIAESIDNFYAFAVTSNYTYNHQFDLIFNAIIADEGVRYFIEKNNLPAYEAIESVFRRAIDQNLWQTRRNSVQHMMDKKGSDNDVRS